MICPTEEARAAASCGEIIRRISIGDASVAMERSADIVKREAQFRDANPDGSPAYNKAWRSFKFNLLYKAKLATNPSRNWRLYACVFSLAAMLGLSACHLRSPS